MLSLWYSVTISLPRCFQRFVEVKNNLSKHKYKSPDEVAEDVCALFGAGWTSDPGRKTRKKAKVKRKQIADIRHGSGSNVAPNYGGSAHVSLGSSSKIVFESSCFNISAQPIRKPCFFSFVSFTIGPMVAPDS